MKPGDIVKHKKDKSLIHGIVRETAKSGIRVRVDWDPKDNPRLLWFVDAYYRIDLLEVIEPARTA